VTRTVACDDCGAYVRPDDVQVLYVGTADGTLTKNLCRRCHRVRLTGEALRVDPDDVEDVRARQAEQRARFRP
jgi:hypothetical protein